MKKVFGLLVMTILFAGCDDGDLIFEDINFDDVEAQRCGNLIYKINGGEALLLKIGDSETATAFVNAFPLEPTPVGEPTTITIDNNNIEVVYQLFDGDVETANLCSLVRPATPVIIEDWPATSGNIEIVTTTITSPNSEIGFEGGEKIDGYQHNIVFRNITFQKSDGTTQLYDVFPFGIYTRDLTPTEEIDFGFGEINLQRCPSSNILYKSSGLEGVLLNIDPALLNPAQLDIPKLGVITATENQLTYAKFPAGNTLDSSFFCGTPPVQPIDIWTGVPGVSNVSGVIEVISTASGNDTVHTIRLKNVSFQRGRSTFKLADDYLFGEITIPN